METSFCIYFDLYDLEVDNNGNVTNREKLYIAEYDEDGNFIRRVECKWRGEPYEIPMDISIEEMEQMNYVGDGSSTVEEAMDSLYRYLENHYVEVCVSPETYWQPAEYIIVGLE